MKPQIFYFDLDGTLIDSGERLYRLFCELVPECRMTKQEYWNIKRKGIGHEQILKENYPQIQFEEFNTRWMKRIEEDDLLELDSPFEETYSLLDDVAKKGDISILLTSRQSRTGLFRELDRLGLKDYFDHILVTEKKNKKQAMIEMEGYPCDATWIISDAGVDMSAGNLLGIHTIAVSYGFLSGEVLAKYDPEHIADSVSELRKIISIFS